MSQATINNKQTMPEGYKQTPIGVIPEDWELTKLGDLFDFKNGVNADKSAYGKGIKFINVMEVIDNNMITHETIPGSITLDEKQITPNLVKYGDVLFNRTSETIEEIGLTAVYLDTKATIFGGFVIRGRSKNSKLHDEFKKDCFRSPTLRKQIIARGQGAVRANIGQKDLEKVLFPLPPLAEQQKIAQILSTWDKAIKGVQGIIDHLKLRNKGLGQQLLTGKKRLKGFDEVWQELLLSEIAKRVTRKNEELDDTVVTISAQRGFVLQEDFFKKRVASETLSNYYLIHRGEFAYNKSYSNGYPMGAFKRLDKYDKAVVTTLYTCFRLLRNVNSDYMTHFFEAGLMIPGLMQIAQEGGRAHGLLNIGIHDFFNLKLKLPKLEEQEKIAEVLQNADKELKLYQQKLTVLKEQKKGLMQKLLTGEVRVKTK